MFPAVRRMCVVLLCAVVLPDVGRVCSANVTATAITAVPALAPVMGCVADPVSPSILRNASLSYFDKAALWFAKSRMGCRPRVVDSRNFRMQSGLFQERTFHSTLTTRGCPTRRLTLMGLQTQRSKEFVALWSALATVTTTTLTTVMLSCKTEFHFSHLISLLLFRAPLLLAKW